MSNFNAGAIEANLTLGRSSWNRDLKKTQKEIQDLERSSITIGIDADAINAEIAFDNIENHMDVLEQDGVKIQITVDDAEALARIEFLEEKLDRLDKRHVMVDVDADVINAEVQLDNLENQMDVLENDGINITADLDTERFLTGIENVIAITENVDRMSIDIDVDVDDVALVEAELAGLYTVAKKVDGTNVDIDVNYDRDAMEELVGGGGGISGGGGGHLGLLRILLIGILALSPVLSASMSALGATIASFAGALVGAIGPLAVFGGGMLLLIKRFKDAEEAGKGLSKPMQMLRDSLDGVSKAMDKFFNAIDDKGFMVMAQGLDIFADVLPRLAPLFNATADEISGLLDSVAEFVDSDEFQRMLDWFGTSGVQMLGQFARAIGNLLLFFGRLFGALQPFTDELMQGLVDITARWADWADDLENNATFQKWLDNVRKYGPMVLDMLGSMVAAFIALGTALEPFAGPMIEGLTKFFDAIANADTANLTTILGGLAAFWTITHVLVPVVTSLIGGIEVLAGVLGLLSAPVVAIVAVLGGWAFAIWKVWQQNEEMRTAVKNAWDDIVTTVQPIIEDITAFLHEHWDDIAAWAKDIWTDFSSAVVDAVVIIATIIRAVTTSIRIIWAAWGKDFMQIALGVFQIVGGYFRWFFGVVSGIIKVLRGILTGDWRMMFEGIRKITQSNLNLIAGLLRGGANIQAAIFRAAGGVLRGIWSATMGNLRATWSSFRSWIGGAFSAFRNWVGGWKVNVPNLWGGIVSGFKSAMNAVIGMWNNLSFSMNIPDKIPGLPSHIGINTPNVGFLAKGGYVTDPGLFVVGEGPDNEVVAPEPVLRKIVAENSGSNIDYGRLAAAIAAALSPLLSKLGGITVEQLERLIEAASVNLNIDATGDDGRSAASRLAAAVGYELRVLGYGGAYTS